MLPWSEEKRKTYTIGATYNYIKLIADRRNPAINAVDHPCGIYRLASSFEYHGSRPVMEGFRITDGAILDTTFCELLTDEEARLEEIGSVQNVVQQTEVDMILGKDVSVVEEMKQDLKDREVEIVKHKNRIKALEEENQDIKKQRDEVIADCGFAIDYRALNVFYIERVITKPNNNYKYDRETTNIGYIIDGKILEWCFSCSRETHERLVKEFSEYIRIKNTCQVEVLDVLR